MTYKILNRMNLVDDIKCLYCGFGESLIRAFRENQKCDHLRRSTELWLRDASNQHKTVSEIDYFFLDK